MSNPYAYFDSISESRAVGNFTDDEQAALRGDGLISVETEADIGPEAGIYEYVTDNFASFISRIRDLHPRDQEMLLSYYCLAKTQQHLGGIFRSTQTVCSARIRASVRSIAAVMMWGGSPTSDIMEPILARAGFPTVAGHPLAELAAEYIACRSFSDVAMKHGVHRPLIRKSLRSAATAMMGETQPPDAQALGWFLNKLISHANPRGMGLGKPGREKEGDVAVTIPDIAGKNRVSTRDRDIAVLFQPRANF